MMYTQQGYNGLPGTLLRWLLAAGLIGLGTAGLHFGKNIKQNQEELAQRVQEENKRDQWRLAPTTPKDILALKDTGLDFIKNMMRFIEAKHDSKKANEAVENARLWKNRNQDLAQRYRAAKDVDNINDLYDALKANNITRADLDDPNNEDINEKVRDLYINALTNNHFSQKNNNAQNVNFNTAINPPVIYTEMPPQVQVPYIQQGMAPVYYRPKSPMRILSNLALGLSVPAAILGGSYFLKNLYGNNEIEAEELPPSLINKLSIQDLIAPLNSISKEIDTSLKNKNNLSESRRKAIRKDAEHQVNKILKTGTMDDENVWHTNESKVKSDVKPSDVLEKVQRIASGFNPIVGKVIEHLTEE